MADSTTTNGVVLQTPYAFLRNFVRTRPFTVSVIGINPMLNANSNNLRVLSSNAASLDNGMIVYVGDKISFDLQAPCNDAAAAAFDVIKVNPSTGVESSQATVTFSAVWQRRLVMTITAINGSNGTVTYSLAYL